MTLRRKYNGAKHGTEALNWIALSNPLVGERSQRAEAVPQGMVDCCEVIMLT